MPHGLPISTMVSTRSGLKCETFFKGFNPPPIAMIYTDTLQQLQTRIADMKRCHKKELQKLKADHDRMEVWVQRLQGDEHSSHIMHEHTQRESHPRCTINTQDDPSLSHIHYPEGQTTRRHPFVDRIMEADIPIGWKPLNLEWYDGTTDPDDHLDAFLTQTNLYANDDEILCRVFPTSLKRVTLTWYRGLPPKSIDSFDTLVQRFSSQYVTSHFS